MTTPPAHHDDDTPPLPYANPDISRFDAPWHLWPRFAAIHFGVTLAVSLFAWMCSASPLLHGIGAFFGLMVIIVGLPGWLLLGIFSMSAFQNLTALCCCGLPLSMAINSIIWGLTVNCIVVLYRYWQHQRALQSNRK